MAIVFIWIVLAIFVGAGAASRGRSGVGWFLVAVLLSPLIALLLLLVFPNLKHEKLLHDLERRISADGDGFRSTPPEQYDFSSVRPPRAWGGRASAFGSLLIFAIIGLVGFAIWNAPTSSTSITGSNDHPLLAASVTELKPPQTSEPAPPPTPSQPTAPMKPLSRWLVQEETSKINDSQNVFVSVTAHERVRGRFGPKDYPRLTFACREGRTTMWVNFGGHFMSDYLFGTVTYRVDKRPAKKQRFRESTDHEALGLWSADVAIPFAKELYGGRSLYVKATPHSESAVEIELDITGLEDSIQSLSRACNWSPPKPKQRPKAPVALTP